MLQSWAAEMSFPRTVPLAKKKVNYKVRQQIFAGAFAYSAALVGVGEYLGWWDRFQWEVWSGQAGLGEHGRLVERTQKDDENSWRVWTQKHMDTSTAKSKKMLDENFVANLPVGMQHYINDPKYQIENLKARQTEEKMEVPGGFLLASPRVEVSTGVPGERPENFSPDQLITFTSSKATGGVGEREQIQEPTVAATTS